MVTTPSSRGWRRVSSAALWNSGSSSRNSTPLWAREISPGRGRCRRRHRDTGEAVWWGLRKGRWVTSGWLGCRSAPPRSQISVVSRASCRVISGRMEGRRRASMDLPEPGEPDQQHVVSAGGGDLQRPLHVLLPHDLGKSPAWAASRRLRLPRPARGRGASRPGDGPAAARHFPPGTR